MQLLKHLLLIMIIMLGLIWNVDLIDYKLAFEWLLLDYLKHNHGYLKEEQ